MRPNEFAQHQRVPDKRCSGSIGELNHPRHFGSRHPVSFLVLMSLRRQICTCLPAPYAQGFCTVVMSPVLTKRCTGTLCWICSSGTRQAPWCCPSAQTRKRHDWVSRAGWLWKSVRHIGTRPKLHYSGACSARAVQWQRRSHSNTI